MKRASPIGLRMSRRRFVRGKSARTTRQSGGSGQIGAEGDPWFPFVQKGRTAPSGVPASAPWKVYPPSSPPSAPIPGATTRATFPPRLARETPFRSFLSHGAGATPLLQLQPEAPSARHPTSILPSAVIHPPRRITAGQHPLFAASPQYLGVCLQALNLILFRENAHHELPRVLWPLDHVRSS